MLNAACTYAGNDDGSDMPMTYKDVLEHKYQTGWWKYLKNKIHAMQTKGFREIILMSNVTLGRKTVGN
jgi:hypothetical protein